MKYSYANYRMKCIYAVLNRVIFGPDEDMRKYTDQGALASMVRL